MAKKKNLKRKEREDFTREEEPIEIGEFLHKQGKGKHHLGGSGKLKIKGKRSKKFSEAGDIIICPPSSLIGVMDKFERIDVLPQTPRPVQKELKRVHKGGGRYDVINTVTRTKINEDFLTKDEANELIVSDDGVVDEEDE